MHADWLIPDWLAPVGVRAVCTTRQGGVSLPPYTSMNLGDHVGDDPAAVAENRARLQRALGLRAVFLQQVHGTGVALIDGTTPDGTLADACVSGLRGVACTVMVADCLPVLFTTRSGALVGAAHAGWRGLAAGVLEATLQRLWQALPGDAANAAQTLAWLGPCIGPQAFEVGAEVRDAFVRQQPRSADCFVQQGRGKFLANLAGLARQRLQALGVVQIYGNDASPAWCTVNNPSSFFSHRRDRVSGRFAACIWRP
jgi:YfiH family protein